MARAIAGTSPERTNRLMILGAILFAAIAAILVFVALANRSGGDDTPAAATATVVVAARDIPANTRLTADMLEVKALPVEAALAGGYATSQPVVGLPTRFPVAAGEQITSLKVGLDAIEDEKDLALILEPGQRGFAVQATEVTAVGGLLLPGNFVDVIAVFNEETGGVPKAVTVLQNIEVLSIAQEAQEPVPAVAADAAATGGAAEETEAGQGLRGQRPAEVERQPSARSVTMAVAPEQAQLLAVLQAEGAEIWLALRPIDEDETVPLDDTNLLKFHSPPLLEP